MLCSYCIIIYYVICTLSLSDVQLTGTNIDGGAYGTVDEVAFPVGVARIAPRMRAAATMTKGHGASVYMPPEATAPASSDKEKSTYNSSIDIFSLGVVTIFTVGETFPCVPLAPTYLDKDSGLVMGYSELQQQSKYMRYLN